MLSRSFKNSKTLFRLAMVTLIVFFVLGLIHPSTSVEGLYDGARGALLGIAIGLEFLAFRAKRAGRA